MQHEVSMGAFFTSQTSGPNVRFLTCPEGDNTACGARHDLVSFANFLLCQELVSEWSTHCWAHGRSRSGNVLVPLASGGRHECFCGKPFDDLRIFEERA
jgi:hypothetical protein